MNCLLFKKLLNHHDHNFTFTRISRYFTELPVWSFSSCCLFHSFLPALTSNTVTECLSDSSKRSCFTVKEGPSRPFYLVLEIWWFHQPEEEFRFSKFRRILHCGSVQDSHTDSITANLKTTATTTKNPKMKLIYLNSIYIEYFLHHDYRMAVYPGNLSITDRNIWFLFSFFFFFLF